MSLFCIMGKQSTDLTCDRRKKKGRQIFEPKENASQPKASAASSHAVQEEKLKAGISLHLNL